MHDKLTYGSSGSFTSADGDTIVDCADADHMQEVKLLMNDKWAMIQAKHYLTPIRTSFNSVARQTGMCSLCVKQSSDDDWHVGTTLLMDYYAEFDFENKALSLTALNSGTKPQVPDGTTPATQLGTSTVRVATLSGGIVLVTSAFIALCFISALLKMRAASSGQATKNKEATVTNEEIEVLI